MTLLFEVNGNDAFGYLKEGSLTHEVSGIARRATLSCTLLDMPGLDNLKTVEWDDSDGTHFLGFISSITRKATSKRTQGVEQVISCRDISFRAYDLMISSLHGRRTTFEFSDDVVTDVVGYHWPELDLTDVTAHVTVKAADYTQFTVGDFLDAIASLAGAIWYVDADLALHFVVPAYTTAPFNLSDQPNGTTTFGWEHGSLELGDEAEELNNRIYTRAANLPYLNYQDDASVARYGVRYGSIKSTEAMTRAEMDAAAAAMLAEKAWPKREGSATIFEPGMGSGMEFTLTAVDHELSAAPHYTVSVTTKYPVWSSPRYSLKFVGDKDRPIGPEGTPPDEAGPSEPSTPSKTLAEELRRKGGGSGSGTGGGTSKCCPPLIPYVPIVEAPGDHPEAVVGGDANCDGAVHSFAGGSRAYVCQVDLGQVYHAGTDIEVSYVAYVSQDHFGTSKVFNTYLMACGADAAELAALSPPASGGDVGTTGDGEPILWQTRGACGADSTAGDADDWGSTLTATLAKDTSALSIAVISEDSGALWYTKGSYITVTTLTDPSPEAYPETDSNAPLINQEVPWEGAEGDGSTTDYVTNYPYAPGSLVVIADGLTVIPDETDPAAGEFSIYGYALGTPLAWRYQATSTVPTGADNPDADPNSPIPGVATSRWELVFFDDEPVVLDHDGVYMEVAI